MGKTDQFKDKPVPPRKESILSDLANAEENDVVFKTQYPGNTLRIEVTWTRNKISFRP